MAEENGYRWESRVECVVASTATELTKKINTLYEKRFIVGTQVFPIEDEAWVAFVYYKVRIDKLPRRVA